MYSMFRPPSDSVSLDERLVDGFAERLAPHFLLKHLESHPASICGLLSDGEIAYVNPAWVQFALENGAPTGAGTVAWTGQRYLDVIAVPLRPFYATLFSRAHDADSASRPASHMYECSSATTFRQFAMKVYALANDAGYVVINTLVASRPHDSTARVPQSPNRLLYALEDGVIMQCAHCRLIRRTDRSRWDWVPAWVEQSPRGTSHGVCEVCLDYYYPDVEPEV